MTNALVWRLLDHASLKTERQNGTFAPGVFDKLLEDAESYSARDVENLRLQVRAARPAAPEAFFFFGPHS